MSIRPEKKAIVEEIGEQIENASFVFLADYRGLSVEQLTDLRGRLREMDTGVHVVRNTFLKHAAKRLGWDSLTDADGPTAVIAGLGDVTVVAKAILGFVKEHQLPVLKGGQAGASGLTAEDIQQMATIPSREVLLGQFVGTLAAPMSQLVGVMHQKLSTLVYVLKAVEEKKSSE